MKVYNSDFNRLLPASQPTRGRLPPTVSPYMLLTKTDPINISRGVHQLQCHQPPPLCIQFARDSEQGLTRRLPPHQTPCRSTKSAGQSPPPGVFLKFRHGTSPGAPYQELRQNDSPGATSDIARQNRQLQYCQTSTKAKSTATLMPDQYEGMRWSWAQQRCHYQSHPQVQLPFFSWPP